MIINMSGGGSPGKIVTVHVTPGAGATVTCTNGKKTYTGTTDSNGDAIFKLTKGPWTITAENIGASILQNVSVMEDCTVNISLEQIPDFTYTGDYEIVNDNDTQITSTLGDWKIRFLTSGTLTFTALNGAGNGIDVFLVGGGGSGGFSGNYGPCGNGGGSGYTKTNKKTYVTVNTPITITIGAGGAYPTANQKGNNGGETSFGGMKAAGGFGGGKDNDPGGNGGSGGNGKWADERDNRGTDGSDGETTGSTQPGKGQKSQPGPNGETGSTREFGDPSGKLYAYGGYAAGPGKAIPKDPNTGDGGDAGSNTATNNGAGGSGIVIIRNARR